MSESAADLSTPASDTPGTAAIGHTTGIGPVSEVADIAQAADALDPPPPGDGCPIVVVNGLPGAGKTTVAAALGRRFVRAAVIEGDRLQHELIVRGGVDVGDEPVEEGWRQLRLRWANIAALAVNLHDAGFTVVVDSLTIPSLLRSLRETLGDRPLAYVHLDPTTVVRRARDAARGVRAIGGRYDSIASEFEPLRSRGVWIDSSELDVDATVEAAYQGVVSGRARW